MNKSQARLLTYSPSTSGTRETAAASIISLTGRTANHTSKCIPDYNVFSVGRDSCRQGYARHSFLFTATAGGSGRGWRRSLCIPRNGRNGTKQRGDCRRHTGAAIFIPVCMCISVYMYDI